MIRTLLLLMSVALAGCAPTPPTADYSKAPRYVLTHARTGDITVDGPGYTALGDATRTWNAAVGYDVFQVNDTMGLLTFAIGDSGQSPPYIIDGTTVNVSPNLPASLTRSVYVQVLGTLIGLRLVTDSTPSVMQVDLTAAPPQPTQLDTTMAKIALKVWTKEDAIAYYNRTVKR